MVGADAPSPPPEPKECDAVEAPVPHLTTPPVAEEEAEQDKVEPSHSLFFYF